MLLVLLLLLLIRLIRIRRCVVDDIDDDDEDNKVFFLTNDIIEAEEAVAAFVENVVIMTRCVPVTPTAVTESIILSSK